MRGQTLLIPKINHISLVLPSLNKKDLKSLEHKLYSFIWKGRDKMARVDAKAPEKMGGLNLPDLEISWKAFKL